MSDTAEAGVGAAGSRTIFLSYRSVDDVPPPGRPKGGYVRYLREQLEWRLSQLGVLHVVLWMDRYNIQPGDIWTKEIEDGLKKSDLFITIWSRNYITSEWCENEIHTMRDRFTGEDQPYQGGRIFRVDKHSVPDDSMFADLRDIQAIRFYEYDKELQQDQEFYAWGRVVERKKYFDAVDKLAFAVSKQLNQLGAATPLDAPVAIAKPSNGRVVFLGVPAKDMASERYKLACDLTLAGYKVVPDPQGEFPSNGDEVRAAVEGALKQAEFSIHLLGEKTGFRPDGFEADIVPYQFGVAADDLCPLRRRRFRLRSRDREEFEGDGTAAHRSRSA
jgi:hypothetical protein